MEHPYIGREAIFYDGSELLHIKVIDCTNDDKRGTVLTLEVIEDIVGYNDSGDIEYKPYPEKRKRTFSVGGTNAECGEELFTIPYVSTKISFRSAAIDSFIRRETEWTDFLFYR